jgi:signal peptidase II
MSSGNKNLIRIAVVLVVVGLFTASDLVSKRWMESNLADWSHLLPVKVDSAPGAKTVGDVLRARFPGMTDAELKGNVFAQPDFTKITPTDKVHSLENQLGSGVEGFLVFEPDSRFARRVPRLDAVIVKRLVARAAPDSDPGKAVEAVKTELAPVTVRDFILDRIPEESASSVDTTIATRLFVIPAGGLKPVALDSSPEKGATYLLADRTINIIDGFWDFSYAENPAGAFSMMLSLDHNVRRAIFLVFSIIAILALGYMLIRPPSNNIIVSIALGAIMGGAIGNLVDRVSLSYVVDFIHMYRGNLHWPRYNIADIGVSVGVCVLLLVTMISPSATKVEKKGRK